jgi:hypothetical protein
MVTMRIASRDIESRKPNHRRQHVNKNPAPQSDMEVPKEIEPFVPVCPPLLPGETERDYFSHFDLLMDEIRPGTPTEWFAVADIADLFWEIGRYRAWKGAILNIYRRSALETALRQTHSSRVASYGERILVGVARKEAEEWRTDPEKRDVLESRLEEHGYDELGLNACALLEALVPLATIERFLSSARGQLNAMLKEVYVRREFAERARKAFNERLQATVEAPKPKQIGVN